jgi:hypothetical protein
MRHFKSIIVLAVLFLNIEIIALAQELKSGIKGNYIQLNPTGWFVKGKVHMEWVRSSNIGLGFNVSLHYRIFEGIRAEGFVRRYVQASGSRSSVPYVQLKGGYGRFISELNYKVTGLNGLQENFVFDAPFKSINLGLALGIKFFLDSKQRWVGDFNLGMQYSPWRPNPVKRSEFERRVGPVTDGFVWHTLGPGAILQPSLSFGYRF